MIWYGPDLVNLTIQNFVAKNPATAKVMFTILPSKNSNGLFGNQFIFSGLGWKSPRYHAQQHSGQHMSYVGSPETVSCPFWNVRIGVNRCFSFPSPKIPKHLRSIAVGWSWVCQPTQTERSRSKQLPKLSPLAERSDLCTRHLLPWTCHQTKLVPGH